MGLEVKDSDRNEAVHWNEKARRKLYPRERTPGKLGKPDSLWKKAVKKWKSEPWERGLGMNTPTLRRAVSGCLACLPKSPCADAEGVLLIMLNGEMSLIESWLANDQVEKALKALAEADGLDVQEAGERCFVYRAGDEPHGVRMLSEKHWAAARKALLALPDQAFQRALECAEELRVGASLSLRCNLSFCFPTRPDWAATDAQELITNPPSTSWGTYIPESCWLLLHSLQDVETAQKLISSVSYFPEQIVWPLLEIAEDRILEILSSHMGKLNNYGAGFLKTLYQALSLVESLEMAEFMASKLSEKLPKAAATSVTDYFQTFPQLAVQVLPGKGKKAESLLSSIVRSHPELNSELSQKVSPGGPQADPSELPELLRDPPWRKGRTRAPGTVVKGVETRDYPSRVDWRGMEVPKPYFYDRPPRDPDPERVERDLAKLRRSKSLNIFEIDRAVDQAALQFLAEAPSKVWSIYQDDLFPLVSRFGVEAAPGLITLGKKRVDLVTQALSHIADPRVAPFMAESLGKKRGAKNARFWLESYPEAAATGLIPVAVGKHGKARQACEQALRLLHPAIVKDVAERYGDEVSRAVGELLDVDPLLCFPEEIPQLPGFAEPKALPALRTRSGKVLPREAVVEVLTMLCFSPLQEPYAGLEELKQHLTQDSLEEFVWELFQAWMLAGAPPKEDWAFRALAHFGGDEGARRITPLIRKWPGESAHQRAVLGLDILGQIGSDVALMNLNGIAQKLRYKALQTLAREKIEEIANRRSLSSDQLADRLVPDLGIGEDGLVRLDFGPRQFEVCFDEQLKPRLSCDGKAVKSLPKPNQKDDSELSSAAVKQFKALKKDLKQIAQGQVLRLQRAMAFRRRWTLPDFQLFLVEQPLIFQLTRRLVWGVYQEDRLQHTFRVVEDRSFADREDEELKLVEDVEIGIPHPLELSKEDLDKWNTLLSDYELLQPFEQLARPVFRVEEAEKSSTRLARFEGRVVPFGSLLSLEERGWQRDEIYDGGVVGVYFKPYSDVHAVLRFDPGLYLGSLRESGDQTLGPVILRPPGVYDEELPLATLHPILVSELLLDLEAL